MEERRTILNIEHPVARDLGEMLRTTHKGSLYFVTDPRFIY
jgi:hypothetical protein